MAIANMAFSPTTGLNDATYSPTNPASEAAIRSQIQGISDQLRDYINNTIKPNFDLYETISDLTTNRKLSATGDFTGTLNGVAIEASNPVLSTTVNTHINDNVKHITSIERTAWNAKADASYESPILPTLQNSWVNLGGGYETVGYWKDSLGIVHIKGAIKNGTIGAVAFTLPIGYRPLAALGKSVASNGAFGIVQIGTDGSVTPVVGNNTSFYISDINFRAGV